MQLDTTPTPHHTIRDDARDDVGENLPHGGWMARDIPAGSLVPHGIAEGSERAWIRVDFDGYDPLWEAISDGVHRNTDRIAGYLTRQAMGDIDPVLFTTVLAFARSIEPHVSWGSDVATARGEESSSFRDIMDSRVAVCTELCVLAHEALRRGGIDSYLLRGAVLRDPGDTTRRQVLPHVYLVDDRPGCQLVVDAAFPLTSSGGAMPAIFRPDKDILKAVRHGNPGLVRCREISGDGAQYFGVGAAMF